MPRGWAAAVLLVGLFFGAAAGRRSQTARRSLHDPVTSGGVAACLAVKDQHIDLREWIIHHRSLGVSKFYVFDNNSTTPLLDDVADFVKQGLVKYTWESGVGIENQQAWIYDRCIALYRENHDWMAFIDVDEFLVVPNGGRLPSALAPYSAYGGLVVNWRQFGSSGHESRPAGGVRANYVKCFALDDDNNKHVKTIANLRHVDHCIGTHEFAYHEGYTAINTRKEPIDGPFSSPPAYDKLWLYHYVTRSREDYQSKMLKGAGDRTFKPASFFDDVNNGSTADCLALLPMRSSQ